MAGNIQLTLIDLSFVTCIALFINPISPTLILVQMTRLTINFEISTDILCQFKRTIYHTKQLDLTFHFF
jgi:hypothetical protein